MLVDKIEIIVFSFIGGVLKWIVIEKLLPEHTSGIAWVPSWKVMEKIGMTYEGTLREDVFRWEEYYDTVFYGMLKSEFK